MSNLTPFALVVDSDSDARKLAVAALSEAGFVAAGFARPRGALATLAARPPELAVIAGHLPDGSDGVAAARQMRLCERSTLKVLFTAAAGISPAMPGPLDGHVVTRPFDRRRFLAAAFELVARDNLQAGDHRAAELGLAEAELACLSRRYATAERTGAEGEARHLACRIRDTLAARQTWLLPAASPAGVS